MIEVHTGTKPGRPTVLLILSAAALAAALGLAWVQVRAARSLEPEQRITGTPLVVRPPKGWIAEPSQPGLFVLPVRVTSRGRDQVKIDRQVWFQYQRLSAFEPPAEWLSATLSGELRFESARIGRFDAVQVRQVERLHLRRQIIERESIWRVTVLPAGHVIRVLYVPMTELTIADMKLLDKMCDAVRIEQPTLGVTPREALQRAGVEFGLESGWQVELPWLPEIPGLYVGGSEDGFPAWSVGIFRTWLASGRKPTDLLHDFAAMAWPLARDAIEVREWRRADGARVATVRQPASARAAHPVASVWLVAESASEAVILFVYTSQGQVAGVDEIAQRITEQVAITPHDAMSTIDEAEAAGAAFTARLAREDLARWWGGPPLDLRYDGTTPGGGEVIRIRRQPVGASPDHGYKGDITRAVRNQKRTERTYWTTDGRGDRYAYEAETYRRESIRIVIREQRLAGADVVRRKIELNDVVWWSGTFRPGPAFVCPPIESLAEAWAARHSKSAMIVEAGTLLGTGTHSRLLRPLPPEGGYGRVLLQVDYNPTGVILAFDEDNEVLYELSPTARYERVSR